MSLRAMACAMKASKRWDADSLIEPSGGWRGVRHIAMACDEEISQILGAAARSLVPREFVKFEFVKFQI